QRSLYTCCAPPYIYTLSLHDALPISVVPTREWRELYAALDGSVVAAIHPFYTASFRQFELAGRKIVGSAPVGHDGTEAWLESIGDRKSTRLNSSHVKISYAVFCLKKK